MVKNRQNFWAGIMFIAFGVFFLFFGREYEYGNPSQMGPGYFPTLVSIITLILGSIIVFGAMSPKAEIRNVGEFAFSKVVLILAPIVLFGVLLQRLGLVISLLLLLIISSKASYEFTWRGTLLNALFLIAFCAVLFVVALQIELPLWPSFILK